MSKPKSERALERARIRSKVGGYLTEGEYLYYGKFSDLDFEIMRNCYNYFYNIVTKENCEGCGCEFIDFCAHYDVFVVHGLR